MATYDWAMCNKNTGQIEYIMSVNNNSDYSQAGFYGEYRTFEIESDADHTKAIEESYYDYDSSIFKARSKQPTAYYVWTTDKQWAVDDTALMADLRQQRTIKLVLSDWTQMADSPLTDEKKAEWATYRQSLRDITEDVSDSLDALENFGWPIQPS